MVEKARAGFMSGFGNYPAEGIVAYSPFGLLDVNGNRLAAQLKCEEIM